MIELSVLPYVGRMPVPACQGDESEFVERVNLLLGDRLKRPNAQRLEQDEDEFSRFCAWARAFGFRDVPTHGAIVAGYLMALMAELGFVDQVCKAARAIASAFAARGLSLDDRYLKAAVAWAKDFRAGGKLL
jgi:hypothetical protein